MIRQGNCSCDVHGTSDISRTLQPIVFAIFGLAQMTYFSLFLFIRRGTTDAQRRTMYFDRIQQVVRE